MSETIEELQRRRDLLAEIKELTDAISDNIELSDLKDVAGYVENLRAFEDLVEPDEDTMKAVADHLANLKELEGMEVPSEDYMEDVAKHVANLRVIADSAA
jgi:hypothetical protein